MINNADLIIFHKNIRGLYNKTDTFYIHGSVQRNNILIRSNRMQQYAGLYLLQKKTLLYMFRVSIAPIIRST